MELSHLSYEGDQQQGDDQDKEKKRRFNPINPVTKKAVNGWLSPSETFSKAPPEPEHRMPVSIVAPENSNEQSRTVSHEAAFHSDAWLGGEVRPPEYPVEVSPPPYEAASPQASQPAAEAPVSSRPTEEDAFQRLLERAGLDELARSLKQPQETPGPEASQPSNVSSESNDAAPAAVGEQQRDANRSEYVLRSQARTRALISFAAGLLIGNRLGKDKVRSELTKTLEQIPNATNEQQKDEDPFNLQPEEHVERDAWHSIVVDKYGREDVDARLQYGRAFQQEQREILPSALSDDAPTTSNDSTQSAPAVPSNAQNATGTMPLGTTPMLSGPVPQPQLPMPGSAVQSLPAGLTQPQLPAGPPSRKDPQHLLPAHTKIGVSVLLNPWVWLVAGLLILVFFAASLIG